VLKKRLDSLETLAELGFQGFSLLQKYFSGANRPQSLMPQGFSQNRQHVN
jgi:hypothetical protein